MYDENPPAYVIEVETLRDKSRRRAGEIRLFASIFLRISKNKAGRKTLDKIYVSVANPFEYLKKPPVATYEFKGKRALADTRNFIATMNHNFSLLKPIPDFCWQNFTECYSNDDDLIAYDYLEWFKSYLKRAEVK
jgi:hypothetical protein